MSQMLLQPNCHNKKVRDCCILQTVLLITTTLLIVTSIYCHLIKYQTKHLLPFHE